MNLFTNPNTPDEPLYPDCNNPLDGPQCECGWEAEPCYYCGEVDGDHSRCWRIE